MNKIKKIWLLMIMIVVIIALMDIFSSGSGLFGDYESYTNGLFDFNWWILFRNIALMIIASISITYYVLYKDKSGL